ncbi:MAG: sodium-translocating pyrophosphatase [Candidatus Nanopelagicales bacterium]|jgi:K(+)-stimulated pyrophosphate-energized sodium pump|nr:sodium-translocating pyrophosphatase [Candidatus Nanopelagicales bacterium]MDP4666743.1 sodium-translocating pyrophosphatase [Candidatus Nanopelagicales bacterium]MDP4895930.1 sodium-translocating pyrophosphatase [Candidatus Nanopelagicales bacterium]MDP5050348.1 sodium-translocating pyrophosphatase [Candidatus Nanopelagicales bacterium]
MSVISHVASQEVALTGTNYTTVVIVALIALAALGVAALLVREVLAADEGTDSMKKIAKAIQEGASAYLNRQFRTLAVFGVLVFFLLFLLPADTQSERIGRSLFFLVGAVFSGITGYMGMWLAVRGNVRVAAAANASGEQEAMKIAFRTGGVAGMFTVGLGLFGAAVVVLVYKGDAPKVLEGFGFGAALLAMFMRVGGGIFTKAADVGADLVGKVEQGIPEDDPRNAATIADNVGDNVGDCAGMAADLFESYAVTLVAALILGKAAFGEIGLVFPLVVPAIGVVTAVIGIFAVTPRPNDRSGMSAINRGFFLSAVISAVLVAAAAYQFLPATLGELKSVADPTFGLADSSSVNPRFMAIGAVLMGIVLAAAIQQLTGYFTETNRKPVDDVSKSSLTGPATVILAGISLGMESAVYSALLIGTALYGAYLLGGASVILGLFAIALAGTGLLTTVGVIVSMDTFGPVSDNAQGIAEMSGDVHGEGAQVLTNLDAVGNTTKAITKGIAIATAVFAATALFGAFRDAVTIAAANYTGPDMQYKAVLDIANPANLFGLLIGAAVVFMFSGLAINAVSRAAGSVIFEVRRQFREKPGIMAGTELPDYSRVVDIVTKDSLRELATPGLLAVLTPIAVGFGLGIGALGSFLAGTIATGTLMAVFLSNSGGAWDNAKKFVEDGHFGGKGSDAHAATVIGDTVGDPFKDTAGPAINPLLKVMNLVALLIAPAVVAMNLEGDTLTRVGITVVATLVIVVSVIISKRRPITVGEEVPVS